MLVRKGQNRPSSHLFVVGDIVAFNNGRVMHAREAFNSQQERQLEGVYAEWDYLMSAWRLAKSKLQQDFPN